MIVFLFIFGLTVGSFLNSVIFRLEKQESVVKHRSYCPYCKQTLAWFELIPVVSFILQRGRCRHCKKRISLQYPIVELVAGALFAFIGFNVFWLFAASILIIIFVYDLKHYIIPNEVIYPGIILGFGFRIWNLFPSLTLFDFWSLVLGILPALFFLAIILVSRGKWMGMGDVKLAVFMGLVLGWPNILTALFLSFLIGALVSLVLIFFKKKNLKSQIPFGPFLAGATIVAIFWGDILINWYLNLFIL